MHVVTNEHAGEDGVTTPRRPLRRILSGAIASLVLFAALAFAADRLSPWPVALITRTAFTRAARKAYHRQEKHLPATIYDVRNQHYDASDPEAYLDVYSSVPFDGTPHPGPAVVWIHGGAWLSGNKNDVANYSRILASHGPTVVAVDYSLAPASLYPEPLLQINTALAYLVRNAERLHIDRDRIFLAGDSAGAQLAAQLANIISSPDYATTMGIHPAIERSQLKGVLLFCGVYDLDSIDLSGIPGFFMRNALRSYTGNRDFRATPLIAEASVARYLTPDFPPVFLSVGNGDPFLQQSQIFLKALSHNGVGQDVLLFPEDHTPSLRHEYQFDLDTPEGNEALDRSLRFINNH
ncbi:MAG TPA: alpha/beta hydrolase [Edaphobacter sp.]